MHLNRLQKVLWLLVGLACVAFAVAWLSQSQATLRDSVAEDPTVTADFELTAHDGTARSEEDYRGQWMLVFFGFTNCPDVCPMTLSEISVVMDKLGNFTEHVQPLFISIDPERDGPALLAEFVPQFHPTIVGLTGTPQQIEAATDSFKVYYEKIAQDGAPDGYTMGHTSQMFLFDPKGQFVRLFSYGTPAEEIVADLTGRIGADG